MVTVEFFEGWKPLSPLQLAVEEIRNDKARIYLNGLPKKTPIPLSQKFTKVDPMALRLLEKLIAFDMLKSGIDRFKEKFADLEEQEDKERKNSQLQRHYTSLPRSKRFLSAVYAGYYVLDSNSEPANEQLGVWATQTMLDSSLLIPL
ncbi:hypothetical protein Tco_1577438 [Tanacetum coccineum]